MLRPATPLTVLLGVAFVLLLISTLSTPIIKGIPLAIFDGVDFGVFGFCQASKCTGPEIGYDVGGLFTPSEDSDFDLPVSTRDTLSAILIVHPIAALITLIELSLAAAAHFHSPSHSPRYLLGIFILSILDLLVALLAFLVDVLLFVPHMAWGSYIVLAATILIAASGIVSCAMRRTLVSRKARKKRIAENAEMSGENFYNRQAAITVPPIPEPTAPLVNGGPGADKMPAFATYEANQAERTSDERQPLTRRTTSERSPVDAAPMSGGNGSQESHRLDGGMGMDGAYGQPGPVGQRTPPRGGMRGGYNGPPRDEYGNPLPAAAAFAGPPGSRDPFQEPMLRNEYSNGSMNSRGRGGPPGYPRGRGGHPPMPNRGGYGPPGRGGYGPPPARGGYGPPPSRGAYGPPGRGGYGPPVRGGYGPGPYVGPPQQYDNMNPMMAGAAGGMAAGAMMRGGRGPPPGYPQSGRGYSRDPSPAPSNAGSNYSYGRRPSADGYAREPVPPMPVNYAAQPTQGQYVAYPGRRPSEDAAYGGRRPSEDAAYSGRRPSEGTLPRAESPPPLPIQSNGMHNSPVGQAIEMDATSGSPAQPPQGFGNQYGGIRESDDDVAGMVSLQQQRQNLTVRSNAMSRQSETSHYSADDPGSPAKIAFNDRGNTYHQSPLNPNPTNEPVELPTPVEHIVSPIMSSSPPQQGQRRMSSADNYYEDVDPRFAEPIELDPMPNVRDSDLATLPSSTMLPGSQNPALANYNNSLHPVGNHTFFEDPHAGSRSPAESDRSNFTSVSQRGVNPRWPGNGPTSGMGGPPMGGPPMGGLPMGGPMGGQMPSYDGRGYGSTPSLINRRPVPKPRDDLVLNSNPDFQLPGMGGRGRGGMRGRGMGMGGGRMPAPGSGLGGAQSGPYPGT